jgi:hypothetical protein
MERLERKREKEKERMREAMVNSLFQCLQRERRSTEEKARGGKSRNVFALRGTKRRHIGVTSAL